MIPEDTKLMQEKDQWTREVEYKMSKKLLNILLQRGCITPVEYAQIDRYNIESFSPRLAEVYV